MGNIYNPFSAEPFRILLDLITLAELYIHLIDRPVDFAKHSFFGQRNIGTQGNIPDTFCDPAKMPGKPEAIPNHEQKNEAQDKGDSHEEQKRKPSDMLPVVIKHMFSYGIRKPDQITPCSFKTFITAHKNCISLLISTPGK